MSFAVKQAQPDTEANIESITLSNVEGSICVVYEINIRGTAEVSLMVTTYEITAHFKEHCRGLSIPPPNPNYSLSILSRLIVELVKNTYDALELETSEKITCEIALTLSRDQFSVSYRDFGPGFPTEFLKFQPELDYRVILSSERNVHSSKEIGKLGGHGLGLARISQLSNAFGGSLIVKNHPERGAIATWSTLLSIKPEEIRVNCPIAVAKHDLVLAALAGDAKFRSFYAVEREGVRQDVPEEKGEQTRGANPFERVKGSLTVNAALAELEEDGSITFPQPLEGDEGEDDGFNERPVEEVQPSYAGSSFAMFPSKPVEGRVRAQQSVEIAAPAMRRQQDLHG